MSGQLRRGARAGGFTLIELMVVVAVVAILMAVGGPAYTGLVRNTKLSHYTGALVSSTLLARGEAIRRNTTITLCVSADGASCGTGRWDQGWIVMCNTSDGVVCNSAGADTLVIDRQEAAATGWRISEADSLTAVSFDSTGSGASVATFTLCQPSGTSAVPRRQVKISAAGRPTSAKLSDSSCG